MKLSTLIDKIPGVGLYGKDIDIHDFTSDSRNVHKDSLFAAIGLGRQHLKDALSTGLAALVSVDDYLQSKDIFKDASFTVADRPDQVFGQMVSKFYNHPSSKLHIVGVTGTNGKTSVVHVLGYLWKSLGYRSATIGTLGVYWGDKKVSTGFTTPTPEILHKLLAEMIQEGITHVAMEASSEALSLGRLEGCLFSGAIFTNLTPDHLDYHKTMEDYYRAKMHLFELTKKEAFIIVNTQGEYGAEAAKYSKSLGRETIEIETPDNITLPFPIEVLRWNATLALRAIRSEERERARGLLGSLPEIPGRFNRIFSSREDIYGVVDYAHSPDALERLLQETKSMNPKTLICVFGCGGNRDKTKRPLMGEISERLSDITIVTEDNPRNESPSEIRKDIIAGMTKTNGSSILEIEGRREAIRKAVELSIQSPAPVIVVVAGKGHEDYQIIKEDRLPFSDRDELKNAFEDCIP